MLFAWGLYTTVLLSERKYSARSSPTPEDRYGQGAQDDQQRWVLLTVSSSRGRVWFDTQAERFNNFAPKIVLCQTRPKKKYKQNKILCFCAF
jgi:hypothetical protein